MKKFALCAAVVSLVSLASCSPSTPEEFAKKNISLTKEMAEIQLDVAETAIDNDDPEFFFKYLKEVGELSQNDPDLKAAQERLKTAKANYKKMLSEQQKNR